MYNIEGDSQGGDIVLGSQSVAYSYRQTVKKTIYHHTFLEKSCLKKIIVVFMSGCNVNIFWDFLDGEYAR